MDDSTFNRKITILVFGVMALLLVGYLSYPVLNPVQEPLDESPTILTSWSTFAYQNTTLYNQTWYQASIIGNNSVDILPTLSNESWLVGGGFYFLKPSGTDLSCNFTLTIPKSTNYYEDFYIERITVLTNLGGWSGDAFDIFGETDSSIELNITNVCNIMIFGQGRYPGSPFGDAASFTPTFRLSNFVVFDTDTQYDPVITNWQVMPWIIMGTFVFVVVIAYLIVTKSEQEAV